MCSSRDVPVSSAEPVAALAPEPGARFREEIREQPDALLRLLETESEFARVGAEMRARGADDDPDGRPRLVRQCRLLRRVRLRPPARVDRAPGLDLADRVLRRRARHVRMHGARALPVRTDAGRGRVRAPRQEPRRLRRRDHERSLVGARRGRRRRARAASRARAGSRGDEDVHEPARCARPTRRPYDRRGRRVRRRACAPSPPRCRRSSSRSSRGSRTSRFRSPMPGACSSSAAEPSSQPRARSR